MDFVTDRTVQFIQDIRQQRTLDELSAYMNSTLAELDIQRFSLFELGMDATEGNGALTNFPTEWGDRYVDKKYEYHDPVHKKLLRSKRAFAWEDLKAEGYLEGKSKKIFHEGGDFGLRDGVTIPVFNTNGYTAVITFAAERLADDPRLKPALHLIALYFHGRYVELSDANRPNDFPELTPRERECLRWTGQGKTDWEIGEILGISESTVHNHIENAKYKLRVTTRVQAVVEALRHHLIRA